MEFLPFTYDVEQAGGKIYSVGGAVRDSILGKKSKDLDILITGVPFEKLETILSKYGRVDNVGKSFGIIKFNTSKTGEIDIAIPRTERKNGLGGYQGFDVTSDHNLPIEKDLERRDFTINAIAKDSTGNLIDPFGGLKDIENKLIRLVNPQAFSDDPLRMLRAIQFAARFDFQIEDQTMYEIIKNRSRIKEISPERILIEFDKIVKKGDPAKGAMLLSITGLFEQIFGKDALFFLPDFEIVRTMGEFIFLLSKDVVHSSSVFYRDSLKGDIDTFKEIAAYEIAYGYCADSLVTDRNVIYDMYKVYPKSVDTEIFGGMFTNNVNFMREKNFPFSFKDLPVNGNDLIELGFEGKEIGIALSKIITEIYSDKLLNDRDQILNALKIVGFYMS